MIPSIYKKKKAILEVINYYQTCNIFPFNRETSEKLLCSESNSQTKVEKR